MNERSEFTAYIAGASGLTGGHLLNYLLEHKQFGRVVALTRSPLPFSHPKLDQQFVDFNDLMPEDFIGGDYFYCCLGTTIKKAGSQSNFQKVDLEYVEKLAHLSAEAGFSAFSVISSVGASESSGNFYLRTKGLMEVSVKRQGIDKTLIFRPSLIIGERREARFGETVASLFMKVLNPLMIGRLKKYKAIQASSLAESMLSNSLSKPAGIHLISNEEMHKTHLQYEK
ncbi:MAG: oxidoreductase [Bacteroidetes bacterium]|jgi:uncharacterized protein YbjT (DUF2867 family)|nr:oxidoreductase [Bacteroidota bacterium]